MTEDKNPIDINMGDLIRAVFMNPCDAIAKALEEPAIEEQVRAPSSNELAEIERLAMAAARLQDELKSVKDDRPAKLRQMKKELLGKMLAHGLRELKIPDRPAIEVTTTQSRKPTRKAIIETMERIHDDPKRGKEIAIKLWNAIPFKPSDSLSIPDPAPPEVDSPY